VRAEIEVEVPWVEKSIYAATSMGPDLENYRQDMKM
jgi:hypothetical protein